MKRELGQVRQIICGAVDSDPGRKKKLKNNNNKNAKKLVMNVILGWIRIRIKKQLDPDPNPYFKKQLGPDPEKLNGDPQP